MALVATREDELLLVIPQRSVAVAAHGTAPAESPLRRIVQRLRTQHGSTLVQRDDPALPDAAVAAAATGVLRPTPPCRPRS